MDVLRVTIDDGTEIVLDAETEKGSRTPIAKAREVGEHGAYHEVGDGWIFYPPHRIADIRFGNLP